MKGHSNSEIGGTYRGVPLADPPQESGVQALIDRIRAEGIQDGQQQAQALIDEAHAKARKIFREAEQEAEQIKQAAREEASRMQTMGQDSLRLAARDVILSLKNQISSLFREILKRQVHAQFQQEEFLQQLLLQVCQRELESLPSDQPLTILLPTGLEPNFDSKSNLESQAALENNPLAQYVLSVCQQGLRQNIQLSSGQGSYLGIKIQVEGEQLTVDLTDETVAALLSQYLLPRFRSVLQGYV